MNFTTQTGKQQKVLAAIAGALFLLRGALVLVRDVNAIIDGATFAIVARDLILSPLPDIFAGIVLLMSPVGILPCIAFGVEALAELIGGFVGMFAVANVTNLLAYITLAVMATLAQKQNVSKLAIIPAALTVISFVGNLINIFKYIQLGLPWSPLSPIVLQILLAAGGIVLAGFAIGSKHPANERNAYDGRASCNTYASAEPADGYISMGMHVVLLLLTGGIWTYIWIYRTTRFLNCKPNAERYNPTSKLLLCMFVPFYSIYWFYKHGQRLDAALCERNCAQSDMASLCLVLGILFPLLACVLMQDKINFLCRSGADNLGSTFDGAFTSASRRSAQADAQQLENLKKLKELLDAGIITQDEFDAKKKQILGM